MDAIKQINYKALVQIKACRDQLTAQQFRTLKGQVLAGDPVGAVRGLRTIRTRRGKSENTTR